MRGRVLIVEDDAEMAEFICAVLAGLGCQTASAHSVEAALVDFDQGR